MSKLHCYSCHYLRYLYASSKFCFRFFIILVILLCLKFTIQNFIQEYYHRPPSFNLLNFHLHTRQVLTKQINSFSDLFYLSCHSAYKVGQFRNSKQFFTWIRFNFKLSTIYQFLDSFDSSFLSVKRNLSIFTFIF